jgi:radical SAM superfamily enzyme YgiQ (UPF0313 family)
MESATPNVDYEIVHQRKTLKQNLGNTHKTKPRDQTKRLDIFPITNRSLIDYEKYHQYIGHAGVKYSMAIQASRGCPYKCFYCDIYKTSPNNYRRSVSHFFSEVKMLADIGVKRFEFIDDIFNVNKKSCTEFFELVLKHNLKLHFFFPTGLKGDLLDKDMIDLMIEAGSVGLNLSLEHAAPRMQEVMRKRLDVNILHDNLNYITEKYPHVNLTLNAMHGFPTETEDEALLTLNYIKSIKWLDFPYLHNVRIFPGTEIEHFAIEAGIPKELIEESQDMSYHENAPTLPFSKEFTSKVKMIFTHDYVLNKERLLKRLPYQMKLFSEDELDQKYNAYFPSDKVKSFNNFLKLAKIERLELSTTEALNEDQVKIPDLKTKLQILFPKPKEPRSDALRLLLLDLSSYFVNEGDNREYNVLEPPLGLLALKTYIDKIFEDKVNGKILKSFIDFNSQKELFKIVEEFKPHLIGIRAMTFYSGFFHETIKYLRDNGIKYPIIVGGPYPTASYVDIIKDRNIDLAVIAEGEITLADIIRRMLNNNYRFPTKNELPKIPGIAYYSKTIENRTVDVTAAIPITKNYDKIMKMEN